MLELLLHVWLFFAFEKVLILELVEEVERVEILVQFERGAYANQALLFLAPHCLVRLDQFVQVVL